MTRLRWILAAMLGLAIAAAAWLFVPLYGPPSGTRTHVIEVPTGMSLRAVALRLAEEGVLDQPWRLRLAARLSPGRSVKAGRYELVEHTPAATLLRILDEGTVIPVALTIPEGWRTAQIATAAAEPLGLSTEQLGTLCSTPPASWIERYRIPEGATLEGYLLPDTYHFAHGVEASVVLETMLRANAAILDTLSLPEGFSRHQLLTLASIVEAEARRGDERAKIAAVYHNRLRKGWKLEADPTVAFALGKQGERLTFRDLEVDSAYNTYRNRGLPPGPINCPGADSIRAAARPEPGFEAMYFVADGEGGHVFSRTWSEHSEAVRAYRARRRAGGSP